MNAFTLAFLAALAISTGTRLWLAQRHARHVAAHRDAVPGEFSDRIALTSHQRAADYTVAKVRLGMLHTLIEAALLLVLTLGGLLSAVSAFWQGMLGSGLLQGLALIATIGLISALVDLPLGLYRTFGVEARFGFNRVTAALYLADLGKQALLAIALGAPIILGALWMMDRLGELWWLYAWVAWMAFNLLMLAVFPTWIAPLFNRFSPLDNPELKARVEQLLERCGFKVQGLFVMDGSRRSSHGNAYFTGFGSTKRIVFFDTLLETLNADEIEAVLAHELGHFKRRHVLKRIVLTFVLSFGFLWLLGALMHEAWFFEALHAGPPATGMALILFFLVLPVFTFLLQPIASHYSRRQEFEADAYAARNARARDLIAALVKLYKDNASTLTPDPLHSAFYDSHPPAAERIARLQHA